MATTNVRIKTHRRPGGFDSVIKRIDAESPRLAYDMARLIKSRFRQRVHVITGHMRDSAHIVKVSDTAYEVRIGADYAVYEEYGTRHRPAHPALVPAVRDAAVELRHRRIKGLVVGHR